MSEPRSRAQAKPSSYYGPDVTQVEQGRSASFNGRRQIPNTEPYETPPEEWTDKMQSEHDCYKGYDEAHETAKRIHLRAREKNPRGPITDLDSLKQHHDTLKYMVLPDLVLITSTLGRLKLCIQKSTINSREGIDMKRAAAKENRGVKQYAAQTKRHEALAREDE